MKKITMLDQVTIDKIAAGEVVERPSSVVKELVENSIDAGATAVTVEIKDGGISFIRITDNGAGIEKEQVPLAFCRHATSKITSLEDLLTISSLGFRGEALSSIAAVSQVELITKTPDALTGTRYIIEGGTEKETEEIGAPQGTTFLVRNLFFNTPARAKFLKSPATEGSYIGSLMEQLALSHPDISFKFMQNGQTRLNTSGNGNFKEIIYQIYGREITKELTEIHVEESDISITGYIGKPSVSRGNRAFENYYVNGRYVKNNILTKAIEDGYRSFLMQHKFPFTALFIQADPRKVDVNVHPAKREVRFQNSEEIYKVVYRAVYDALTGKELIPEVSFDPAPQKKSSPQPLPSSPEPFEVRRREQAREMIRETPSYMNTEAETAGKKTEGIKPALSNEGGKKQQQENTVQSPGQMSLFQDRKLLDENSRSLHRIIGQVFQTYWLVQMEDKLFIIDQHAAHEKVLYEQLLHEMVKKEMISQYLAIPVVVTLNLRQMELMRQNEKRFRDFGFEIEPFGGKEYTIRAVPCNLYGIEEEKIFTELLDSLDQEGAEEMTPQLFAQKLATMACKAAVKGNQTLTAKEAEQLIDQLLKLENPYHCPHGRPTIISMSRYELEKKFKRIL
ncbi:MAG: DNA mismatch repair endonuclease MutL [Ruminococcus sp.]|jgi:DNA mismatch repair protein MutL